MKPLCLRISAALLFAGLATTARAATDIALNAPVTSTPYYDAGSETFPASNITDGQLNDTGMPGAWSFWLTPQGAGGTATIDLGSAYTISSFYIQNTLNRGFQDRETDVLNVYVGAAPSVFGSTASYGTLVKTFNFANTEGTGAIAAVAFAITPTIGRYITVDVTSFYGSSGGLNEVEAFGSPVIAGAPEPATWALMILGFGLVGSAFRLSRGSSAAVTTA